MTCGMLVVDLLLYDWSICNPKFFRDSATVYRLEGARPTVLHPAGLRNAEQGATDAVGLEVWRSEQASATPLD